LAVRRTPDEWNRNRGSLGVRADAHWLREKRRSRAHCQGDFPNAKQEDPRRTGSHG
jgi:hypothetical protein